MDSFAGISFLGKATRGVADTHNGARNKPNEDRYITFIGPGDASPQAQFLVVADGVTSTHGGERASDIAVRILREALAPAAGNGRPPRSLRERMADAIHRANQTILETARKDPELKGMSTTLVIAAVDGDQVTLMHLGDSRAYLIRDGKAHQLTRDHTWVQEALEEGRITPEQAANHPNKHVILRYLGDTRGLSIDQGIQTPDKPAMDVDKTEVGGQMARTTDTSLRLREGDALLLCSDGLYNRITDGEIAAVVTSQPPEKAVSWLINEAVRRQEPDNITVVLWTSAEVKAAAVAALPKSRRTALALAVASALLAVMALFIFSRGGDEQSQAVGTPQESAAVVVGSETPTPPVVEEATATETPASSDATPTAAPEESPGETATSEPSPPAEEPIEMPAEELAAEGENATNPADAPTMEGKDHAQEAEQAASLQTMQAIGNVAAGQASRTPSPPIAGIATVTTVPTRTPVPTSTPLPTATPVPSNTPTPTRTPTSTVQPLTVTPPPTQAAGTNQQGGPTSANVESPPDGAASPQPTLFKWTANTALAAGQAFEVLFWRTGEDAKKDGRPLQGASTATEVMLPIANLAPGGYKWAVWLVQVEPRYERLQQLSLVRDFTVSSSGDGGPVPEPTEAKSK